MIVLFYLRYSNSSYDTMVEWSNLNWSDYLGLVQDKCYQVVVWCIDQKNYKILKLLWTCLFHIISLNSFTRRKIILCRYITIKYLSHHLYYSVCLYVYSCTSCALIYTHGCFVRFSIQTMTVRPQYGMSDHWHWLDDYWCVRYGMGRVTVLHQVHIWLHSSFCSQWYLK